jgi:hypothetical protein
LAQKVTAKVTEKVPASFTAKSSDPAFKARANRISDQFLKSPHAHFPVRGEYTAAFGDAAVAPCLKPFAHVVILTVYAVPQLPRMFDRSLTVI